MATLKWIPLSSIVGSIYQPRQQEDFELQRLSDSILLNGMLTPVTVVSAKKGKATMAEPFATCDRLMVTLGPEKRLFVNTPAAAIGRDRMPDGPPVARSSTCPWRSPPQCGRCAVADGASSRAPQRGASAALPWNAAASPRSASIRRRVPPTYTN